MWKPEHRRAADQSSLRYPSDLTNAEWELVAPKMFRTGMALSTCCAGRDECSRSSNAFLLMADTPEARWH